MEHSRKLDLLERGRRLVLARRPRSGAASTGRLSQTSSPCATSRASRPTRRSSPRPSPARDAYDAQLAELKAAGADADAAVRALTIKRRAGRRDVLRLRLRRH